MKIKIVLPVYSDWESQLIPDGAFLYPELKKTPQQQMDWFKDLISKKTSVDDIFIVTTSPYLAEGFSDIKAPIKDGDNFGAEIVPIYSDGREDIDSDTFWKHLAKPMKDTFFFDKESTLKS